MHTSRHAVHTYAAWKLAKRRRKQRLTKLVCSLPCFRYILVSVNWRRELLQQFVVSSGYLVRFPSPPTNVCGATRTFWPHHWWTAGRIDARCGCVVRGYMSTIYRISRLLSTAGCWQRIDYFGCVRFVLRIRCQAKHSTHSLSVTVL